LRPDILRIGSVAATATVLALVFVSCGVSALPELQTEWVFDIVEMAETGIEWSCPILIDLDGDGTQEVIVSTYKAGRLIAVKHPGELMWVFPPMDEEAAPRMGKTPAAGDIDGDGRPEVFFGGGSAPEATLFCLNWDGTERWTWADPEASFKYASIIVRDFDADGEMEVINAADDCNVYVFNHTGGLEMSTFLAPGRGIDSIPNAFDIDKDGDMELFAFSRASDEADGRLYCIGQTGTEEWGWSAEKVDWLHNQPTIADVNGDGEYEVVFGIWDFIEEGQGAIVLINWFGTELARKVLTDQVAHDAMIWDIDGDGQMEILIGSREAVYYCLKPDLTEKWRFNFTGIIGQVSKSLNMGGALGDVTGDGELDVLFQSWQNSTLMILDNDGNLQVEPFHMGEEATTSVVIGDVDNDDKSEIVTCSGSKIYCLTLDAPCDESSFVWSMVGRDPMRSGAVPIAEVWIAVLPMLVLPLLRRR
jgi:hypothetical protein